MQVDDILKKFGLENFTVRSFGNGLINKTWIVESCKNANKFILQKINEKVFKSPDDIAYNISLIASYLKQRHTDYVFTSPIQTSDASPNDVAGQGEYLVKSEEGYFRLFPFINNSHTFDIVQKPEQAYEAAKQFGSFTKVLSGFNPAQLKITLPDFHNLPLRYKQFESALQNGNKQRIEASKNISNLIHLHTNIVEVFKKIKSDPAFKIRVTHHDTKISNVLFNEEDKGICVIDLDTVMPGYFISDMGDMLRTCLSPVNEEEKDFSKIHIRKDFYEAIVSGYLSEMKEELTAKEKKYFIYAGKYMVYMQAIRFITDHLNNDKYYGVKYEGQNFVRAGNQIILLQQLIESEKYLTQ